MRRSESRLRMVQPWVSLGYWQRTRLLVLARKDSEERDDEVDGQERDHVIVRLAAASQSERAKGHLREGSDRRVGVGTRCGPRVPSRTRLHTGVGVGEGSVRMNRDLTGGQRHALLACLLSKDKAVALMDRNPALEIGQGERGFAVPAIGGANGT